MRRRRKQQTANLVTASGWSLYLAGLLIAGLTVGGLVYWAGVLGGAIAAPALHPSAPNDSSAGAAISVVAITITGAIVWSVRGDVGLALYAGVVITIITVGAAAVHLVGTAT